MQNVKECAQVFTNLMQLPPKFEALTEFLKAEKNLLALEEAKKTLRKTACYGYNGYPCDFEWPTPKDLLQMPKGALIKLQDLKYKQSTPYTEYFGVFQVTLSNGHSSPVFTA